jgi:hypothetical protein
MNRHGVLKVAVLILSAVLIGIGVYVAAISASGYLYFTGRLQDPDAQDCAGEKCFCNNLMCRTEAHARADLLKDGGVGTMFMAAGSFWPVLFGKQGYLKTRQIL